jgi:hypothetical protein
VAGDRAHVDSTMLPTSTATHRAIEEGHRMTGTGGSANSEAAFFASIHQLSSGYSDDDLAARSGLLQETVAQLARGTDLFSWEVTSVFLDTCGASPNEWRDEWTRLARERGWRTWSRKHDPVGRFPDPLLARTPAQLVSRMKELRDHVGRLPFQTLENRAASQGRKLPHTTLHAVLGGRARVERDLVESFASACGLPPAEVRRWRAAWKQITETVRPLGAEPERDGDRPEPGVAGWPTAGPSDAASAGGVGVIDAAHAPYRQDGAVPQRWLAHLVGRLVPTTRRDAALGSACLLTGALAGLLIGGVLARPTRTEPSPMLVGPPHVVTEGVPVTVPVSLPPDRDWRLDLHLVVGHTAEQGLQNCSYHGWLHYRVGAQDRTLLEGDTSVGQRDTETKDLRLGRVSEVRILVVLRVDAPQRTDPAARALQRPCTLTLDLNGTTFREHG